MPFVRNPRDRNKQIETQQGENNALSKDLGTVGSVGGALLQDQAPSGTTSTAPTLSSPSPERKTTPLRATNLAEYGRANIGKTQALTQNLASQQAQDVRDFNQRLAQTGGKVQSSLEDIPNVADTETKARDFLAKSKTGQLTSRDYTDLRDAFQEYTGPKSVAEIDPNLAAEKTALQESGADTQKAGLGYLSKQVGDQSGYTIGAGTLDAALVGRQSRALQDTARAAAGAGGDITRADERIKAQTGRRATDLARLIEETTDKTNIDFTRQQDKQQANFNLAEKKLKETKVDTKIATDYIKTANDNYNTKQQALQSLETEMNDFAYKHRLGNQNDYYKYDAIARDPAKYDAYMSDADTHDTNTIGQIYIPTLADFRNIHLPKVQKFEAIVPNGAADVEQAYIKKTTAPMEARAAMTRTYLENFSDEELSRVGTTRDDVISYAMKNDLNLEETTGILQRMGLEPDINTFEDKQYVAALKYLAGLIDLDLDEKKETKPSEEEGEKE